MNEDATILRCPVTGAGLPEAGPANAAESSASTQGHDLPDVPLFQPAFKANPHPYYREWVAGPPFWASANGTPCIVAARYADVKTLYTDHATFSSVKPSNAGLDSVDYKNGASSMAFTDEPDHARLRSVLQPSFTPGVVNRLAAAVQALVGELLDGVDARIEVMSELARPLASRVVLGLILGTPQEDFGVFERYSESMRLLADLGPGESRPGEFIDAWAAAKDYGLAAVDRRMSQDGDDVLGRLVQARRSGRVSDDEAFELMLTLYSGGLSTTATLIGNALAELGARPDQWRLLCADRSLIPQAIEEVLRYNGSGLFNFRFPLRDIQWHGLEIPAGTTVYTVQAASGFDPAAYDDPFRFDVRRRSRNRHLAMGFGIHACLGAPVARLMLRTVLEACTERFPGLRMVPDAPPITYGGMVQERAPEAVHLVLS